MSQKVNSAARVCVCRHLEADHLRLTGRIECSDCLTCGHRKAKTTVPPHDYVPCGCDQFVES